MRPNKPNAHFFTILKTTASRRDVKDGPEVQANGLIRISSPLAITQRNMSISPFFSWTDSNPSAYMIDIGLWTACKESREAMERRFDSTQRNCPPISWPYGPFKNPTDLVTMSRVSLGGERQTIATSPAVDLICFQPISWVFHWDSLRGIEEVFYTNGKLINVAFEFDSKGSMESEISSGNAWADFIIDALSDDSCWIDTVWLIDYHLYRRDDVPQTTDRRQEFYGNKGRFVEVDDHDRGWGRRGTEDEQVWDARDFLFTINYYLRERGKCGDYKPKLGILAYEMLP